MADSEELRETISRAVSDAIARSLPPQSRSRATSGTQDTMSEDNSTKRRRQSEIPSRFLKKKKENKGKGKAVIKEKLRVWTKDIICLPSDYSSLDEIPLPRGAKRMELTNFGLVGKISLSSNMSEEEIRREVLSVFTNAMGGNDQFNFKFLQSIGSGCRALFDPMTSSSFQWTAKEIMNILGLKHHHLLLYHWGYI